MAIVRDIGICVWFALAGLAFWAPYLGMPLPDLTSLYGLFLLASVAAVALRLLNRQDPGAKIVPEAPAARAVSTQQRPARRERSGRTSARRGRGAGG